MTAAPPRDCFSGGTASILTRVDRKYEGRYHAVEEWHWWFSARRHLVRQLATQLCPERSSRILEIGCTSGVLLRDFAREGYASVVGIDISGDAINECRARGLMNVRLMDAQQLEFDPESFDLITASDVLEHLAEDSAALRGWHRVLKPGGRVLIFVPAFPSLWSEHDAANHHHRRYRLSELREKVVASGFAIERESHWNASLFLPIAAIRALKRCLLKSNRPSAVTGELFAPPGINWMLFQILTAENALFRCGVNFPFGLSAMIIARKPPPAEPGLELPARIHSSSR